LIGVDVPLGLRDELTKASATDPGFWHLGVVAVLGLRSRFQHHIDLVRETLDTKEDYRAWRQNCHAYALGLWNSEEAWMLAESEAEAWPTGVFVLEQVMPLMRRRDVGEQQDQDIAVYFQADGSVPHSGRVSGNRVRSKWGSTGHLWDHGVLEVPLSYGVRCEFFAPPNFAAIVEAFKYFAAAPLEVRYPGRRPRQSSRG
jgi:hypothetical protein